MSNVIEFPDNTDFKHVGYMDINGDLGVYLSHKLQLVRLNKDEFEFSTSSGSSVFSREELAEFLHVASVFIDSKDKFKPELDMIGCDY